MKKSIEEIRSSQRAKNLLAVCIGILGCFALMIWGKQHPYGIERPEQVKAMYHKADTLKPLPNGQIPEVNRIRYAKDY